MISTREWWPINKKQFQDWLSLNNRTEGNFKAFTLGNAFGDHQKKKISDETYIKICEWIKNEALSN